MYEQNFNFNFNFSSVLGEGLRANFGERVDEAVERVQPGAQVAQHVCAHDARVNGAHVHRAAQPPRKLARAQRHRQFAVRDYSTVRDRYLFRVTIL